MVLQNMLIPNRFSSNNSRSYITYQLSNVQYYFTLASKITIKNDTRHKITVGMGCLLQAKGAGNMQLK